MATSTSPEAPAPQSRKEAKAQAKAAKAYVKASRPFYKKKRFIFPAALVAVIAIAAGSSGGGDETNTAVGDTPAINAVETPAAPVEAPAEPAEEEGPVETVAQENARRSAEDYLSTSAFSRSGLIEQLVFEGFSKKDATYGVDALDADWKEQAAKSAEDYLSTSAFSRSGLIEQLEFEGYTPEQARYGADQAGL